MVRTPIGGAPALCGACADTQAWPVWRDGARTPMTRGQVAQALRQRSLDPTDAAEDEDGVRLALPAHPALRGLFLPGHPDFLGEEVVNPPAEPFWRRWFRSGARVAAPNEGGGE